MRAVPGADSLGGKVLGRDPLKRLGIPEPSVTVNPSFQVQRRVEFCETDAAGIAHFAAFFPYMEQAEHALYRHLGLSVVSETEEGTISWPRVHAQCTYTGAVRFEDVLDVSVAIERLGGKSVTFVFEFKLDGRDVASGRITAVCCLFAPGKPPRSIPIPAWIAERLRAYALPATQES